MTPLPNLACPLCGGPNACQPAACGTFDVACWCMSATIPAALLAQVPAESQGRACLCAGCVASAQPPAFAAWNGDTSK